MVKHSRFAKSAKTTKVFPLERFDIYGISTTIALHLPHI